MTVELTRDESNREQLEQQICRAERTTRFKVEREEMHRRVEHCVRAFDMAVTRYRDTVLHGDGISYVELEDMIQCENRVVERRLTLATLEHKAAAWQ